MSLILQALSNANDHPASEQIMTHEFKQQSGSIGRSQSNDWVLVDTQKYLSGQHALIEYREHHYILTDTSTNGVFYNQSTQAIGKGCSINLNDGDTLRMGIYDIDVRISSENVYSKDPFNTDPFSDISDEFALDNAAIKDASIDADDPFQNMWQDDFIASDTPTKSKRPSADVLEEHFKPVSVQSDASHSSNNGNNNAPQANENNTHEDWDDNWFSDSNNSPVENHIANNTAGKSNTPSDNEQENANKQADDVWDEDWFQDNTAKNTAEVDNFFIETEIASEMDTSESKKDISTDRSIPAQPLHNQKDSKQSALSAALAASKPITSPITPQTTKVEEPTSIVKNTPDNLSVNHSQGDSYEAKQQFLAGLQLDDEDMEKKVLENLDFKHIGELFKVSMQGTLDILHSRTHIKNEMRMDVTTIQPIENNPLKFSISADEALARLLVPQKNSYLAPKHALEEAYDDIKAHQMAVISGIQATLNYMLKRFEPKKLTTRLQKKSPIAAVIPLHRKAKLWALFEDLYETLQEEAEDDFNHLFSLEFSKAYDQQIAFLKAQIDK